MNFFGKRVLFLGAHPDDIELGCGALVHHIVQQTEILCVTLSDNQQNAALTSLMAEQQQAFAVLGVPRNKTRLGPFRTRAFREDEQAILDYLIRLRAEFKPDLVFVHTRQDTHQDHAVLVEESLRAFMGLTLLGFDVVRSSHDFAPQLFIDVTEEDVTKKIEALSKYANYNDRRYFNSDVTRAVLVRNGALADRPFAEGFEILRMIGTFGIPG